VAAAIDRRRARRAVDFDENAVRRLSAFLTAGRSGIWMCAPSAARGSEWSRGQEFFLPLYCSPISCSDALGSISSSAPARRDR